MIYAELNDRNVCWNILSTPKEIKKSNMILIENNDTSLLGKRWNGRGWEDVVEDPIPEPEPTQLDIIQSAVEKSNEELRQEGADTITLELLERGIL